MPDGAAGWVRRLPPPRWILAIGVITFVLYAANFLYFFVDDEGIPFVYAQSLLEGRGLSYNAIEGRVEGYSDFLHVWLATGVLAVVRLLHLPKLSVFFIGKALSFACGVAVVVLTWAILQRLRVPAMGTVAGMAVVCLSGPLAVWSCSSLETVPFAMGVMLLAWALIADRDRLALAATAFLVLERIDGFIYAAALVGAFVVTARSPRRAELLRRVAAPAVALFVAYHLWRVWYFHDLFPAPLEAKVWYKLTSHTTLVVKAPETPYAVRFAQMYGWVASAGFVAAAAYAAIRGGILRALAFAVLVVCAYVAVVGDWMFGFRFFVPATGLLAVVAAAAAGSIPTRRRLVDLGLCVAIAGAVALSAARFFTAYRTSERKESFLRHSSGDPRLFFGGYFALYETARTIVRESDVIAYNQAGLVPFLLNVSNIDDLGICSAFYGQMPTTDLFFTEVGRYAPLTNKPVIQAGEAYLLYRNVEYLIVRQDLLLNANGGAAPRELLGGFYEYVTADGMNENAIYRRTCKDASRYASDPRAFVENLAHVADIRHASVNGTAIPPSQYLRTFPFFAGKAGRIELAGSYVADVMFADRDEDVGEITAELMRCDQRTEMHLALFDRARRQVYRTRVELEPGAIRRVSSELPPGARASSFMVELSAPAVSSPRCLIADMRVLGQSRKLAAYIARRLTFPAPR